MNDEYKDDTPIEKTRCGSCNHFLRGDCPKNKLKKGDRVPSYFADRCNAYE